MKDSEVVAAARDLIADPAKWIKGNWCVGEPGKIQMCAEGAVRQVLGMYRFQPLPNDSRGRKGFFVEDPNADGFWEKQTQARRIEWKLAKTAEELMPEIAEDYADMGEGAYLHSYNDAEVTKHEDVLAIFDKTRAQLEEEGN